MYRFLVRSWTQGCWELNQTGLEIDQGLQGSCCYLVWLSVRIQPDWEMSEPKQVFIYTQQVKSMQVSISTVKKFWVLMTEQPGVYVTKKVYLILNSKTWNFHFLNTAEFHRDLGMGSFDHSQLTTNQKTHSNALNNSYDTLETKSQHSCCIRTCKHFFYYCVCCVWG